MSATPSPRRSSSTPKPAPRRRRTARPASPQPSAASIEAPAPAEMPAMTSGAAYFTFSNTGELIITSYELAAALQKAGGRAFVDGGNLKIGVYAGTPPKKQISAAAAGNGPKILTPGKPAKKAAAMMKGSVSGYATEGDPQLDSMCQCDVKC